MHARDSWNDYLGRKIVIRDFKGKGYNPFERVAYIEENTFVVMIVLTARDEANFSVNQDAFKQLVDTYRLIAEDQTET